MAALQTVILSLCGSHSNISPMRLTALQQQTILATPFQLIGPEARAYL